MNISPASRTSPFPFQGAPCLPRTQEAADTQFRSADPSLAPHAARGLAAPEPGSKATPATVPPPLIIGEQFGYHVTGLPAMAGIAAGNGLIPQDDLKRSGVYPITGEYAWHPGSDEYRPHDRVSFLAGRVHGGFMDLCQESGQIPVVVAVDRIHLAPHPCRNEWISFKRVPLRAFDHIAAPAEAVGELRSWAAKHAPHARVYNLETQAVPRSKY